MHSKIIQISSKPIPEDEWVDESDYYDELIGVADYVANITRDVRDGIIDEFCDGLVFERQENDRVVIKSKAFYFEKKYEDFQKNLEKIKGVSFADFCGRNPRKAWELESNVCMVSSAYSDRYGTYVDDRGEYDGIVTLDNFVRRSKDGDAFYIGGVVDYHF